MIAHMENEFCAISNLLNSRRRDVSGTGNQPLVRSPACNILHAIVAVPLDLLPMGK